MATYEEFCREQFSRIQGEAIHNNAGSVDPQRVSIIQFHGMTVLSPLLTVENKQEMQQYKQRAIELEGKKQHGKKKSLLTRVQEILETVQVNKGPNINYVAENNKADQIFSNKNLNGFTILPNALNLPMLSVQSEPTKFGKSMENEQQTETESKQEDTAAVKKDSLSLKLSLSPVTCQSDTSCNISMSVPVSQWDNASSSEDAPDPYKFSLQNLLKKSREYSEKEQSKRNVKNHSKNRLSESSSDKENDTIRISNSLKEKAKVLNRSRSCSPLMIDKPMLNKSNTLLQAASGQSQSLRSSSLSTISKGDISTGTSTGIESGSDEELKWETRSTAESSILKSLTGSYAKLPSPEQCLSPKMHRRRPRPLSAGHIVITNPVNAYNLSPKENGEALDFFLYKTAEKTHLSDPVPKLDEYNTGIFSNKQSFPNINISSVPRMPITGVGNKSACAKIITDEKLTVLSGEPQQIKLSSALESSVTNLQTERLPIMTQNGTKLKSSSEMFKHSSPVELNKSYDVDTPSPILMQSQGSNQATDSPHVSCTREQFLENHSDIQVNRKLELDLDSVLPASREQMKSLFYEPGKQSMSIPVTQSDLCSNTSGDHLKKKMLAFEEMRKKLEEQHAYQLSLLIAEQEREQEKLQREFEEEHKRLNLTDKNLPSIDYSTVIPDRKNIDESTLILAESFQSCLSHNSAFESATASSQHSYGFADESSLGLWRQGVGTINTSVPRSHGKAKIRWSQVYSPAMQRTFNKASALAKGFLTRRLMKTEKLKNLKKTVKDTLEFMRTFKSEIPITKGIVSSQDASLQERVYAQLRAALYEIHDIFFTMKPAERMNIIAHDREFRREKMIRSMEKVKSPRDKVALSSATQKLLDRKKLTRYFLLYR
ncbi:hypothetical protein GDO86_017299 [Hymenochirus boettgeri]|uniref:Centriolar coiled coil protein 110kDa n=1 Tax=Hymenochirus boettgeri TaxID=247094 RepID=A0A8T2IJ64_9PIPI|nr:hypothetical protein GDO86_017299 [Hymenochirus boettgeri]